MALNNKSDEKERCEIRIDHAPPKLHNELKNISKHAGIPMRQWILLKLREIVNSYPDHLKQEPKD